MANLTTIAKMYNDLINGLEGVVGRKFIFPQRPDVKEADFETMQKYIVVDLPAQITDMAVGNHKFHLTTTGVLYLFSRAKKNMTYNVNSLSDFTEEVTDRFPISGEYIAAVNPTVLATGVDEFGYQIVTITFDLHSK